MFLFIKGFCDNVFVRNPWWRKFLFVSRIISHLEVCVLKSPRSDPAFVTTIAKWCWEVSFGLFSPERFFSSWFRLWFASTLHLDADNEWEDIICDVFFHHECLVVYPWEFLSIEVLRRRENQNAILSLNVNRLSSYKRHEMCICKPVVTVLDLLSFLLDLKTKHHFVTIIIVYVFCAEFLAWSCGQIERF